MKEKKETKTESITKKLTNEVYYSHRLKERYSETIQWNDKM